MINERLLIIGLDGLPHDFIFKFGKEYNLSHILKKWEIRLLASSIPYNSASGWVSFLTGLDSGDHGVFDLNVRDRLSYKYKISNRNSFNSPTFLQKLNKVGIKTLSINLPMTYPIRSDEGNILAGPFVPENRKIYTNSDRVLKLIRDKSNYRSDIEFKKIESGDLKDEELLISIISLTRFHCNEFISILQGIEWDLAVVTLTTLDRLFHYFWGYIDSSHNLYNLKEGSQIRKLIKTFFNEIYIFFDKIMNHFEKNSDIIILSDHGFGPLDKIVYLPNYLIDFGYFSFPTEINCQENNKQFLRDPIFWNKTTAFMGGASSLGIYINDKKHFSQGVVPVDEYYSFRNELIEKIQTIKDIETDQVVFTTIIPKEKKVKGKMKDFAPDLFLWGNNMRIVCTSKINYDNRKKMEKSVIRSGSHRPEGFFATNGEKITKMISDMKSLKINNVSSIILRWFCCPDSNQNFDIYNLTKSVGGSETSNIFSTLKALGYL